MKMEGKQPSEKDRVEMQGWQGRDVMLIRCTSRNIDDLNQEFCNWEIGPTHSLKHPWASSWTSLCLNFIIGKCGKK